VSFFVAANTIFAQAMQRTSALAASLIGVEISLASSATAASWTLTCFYSLPFPVAYDSLVMGFVLVTSFEVATSDFGVSVVHLTARVSANGIRVHLVIDSSSCNRIKQQYFL
jgi:hypothetical protein